MQNKRAILVRKTNTETKYCDRETFFGLKIQIFYTLFEKMSV